MKTDEGKKRLKERVILQASVYFEATGFNP